MVHEDLTPSKIMTRKAFENAVVVASAIVDLVIAQKKALKMRMEEDCEAAASIVSIPLLLLG